MKTSEFVSSGKVSETTQAVLSIGGGEDALSVSAFVTARVPPTPAAKEIAHSSISLACESSQTPAPDFDAAAVAAICSGESGWCGARSIEVAACS